MWLCELISFLEKQDPNILVTNGFGAPDSYRGYYNDVAFEPKAYVTVGEMLHHAKSAVGATFHGYKGGEYKMDTLTNTWIAEYGCTGDELSKMLLQYMIRDQYNTEHDTPTHKNHPGHHEGYTCEAMGQMLANFGSQKTTPEKVVSNLEKSHSNNCLCASCNNPLFYKNCNEN